MRTLIAATLLLATPGLAVAKPGKAKDEEAIKALCAEIDTAINKADMKAAAALVAEDVTLINVMGEEMNGRAGFEQKMSADLAGPAKGMTHKITPVRIQFIKANVAVGDADIEVGGMKGPDGKPMPTMKHKGTAIFTKQKGKWQMAVARGYIHMPPPHAMPHAMPKK